jgi:hypothetical protein
MKTYTHTDSTFNFSISISWSEERSILRIESGPSDEPQEMIAQFEGLSEHGAKEAVKLWVRGMIDGGHPIAPILEALNLPS